MEDAPRVRRSLVRIRTPVTAAAQVLEREGVVQRGRCCARLGRYARLDVPDEAPVADGRCRYDIETNRAERSRHDAVRYTA